MLAFKFDSSLVPDLPAPRPMFEIWVCSPRVEGVHLRNGPIARGGLRWSDRREDFRTEILGLVKAQIVKNAVIVPTGAKGGFVLKKAAGGADAFRAEGVACYREFICGMLDLTDNIVDGAVVPPPIDRAPRRRRPVPRRRRRQGHGDVQRHRQRRSPREYGFWLGDAFASGGSAGYDHKEMGITARGAWESVRRHAKAIGKDVDRDELTVVGVGDMSGDVFGNGLLRSEHVQLVAAFDHRHVFLDPDPDPAVSFAERTPPVRAAPVELGRLRPGADLLRRRRVPADVEEIEISARGRRAARDRPHDVHAVRADVDGAARPGRPVLERRDRHVRQGVDGDQRRGR